MSETTYLLHNKSTNQVDRDRSMRALCERNGLPYYQVARGLQIAPNWSKDEVEVIKGENPEEVYIDILKARLSDQIEAAESTVFTLRRFRNCLILAEYEAAIEKIKAEMAEA